MKSLIACALAASFAASLLAACNKKDEKRSWSGSGSGSSNPAPPAKTTDDQPPPTTETPAPAPPPTTPATPGPGNKEAVERITKLADQICACKDRACAIAAQKAFAAANAQKDGQPQPRPNEAESKALRSQAGRLSGCVSQLPE